MKEKVTIIVILCTLQSDFLTYLKQDELEFAVGVSSKEPPPRENSKNPWNAHDEVFAPSSWHGTVDGT
jgi:hypothetical protein